MDTVGNGWIKCYYEWDRDFDHGCHSGIIKHRCKTDFNSARDAIEEWVSIWTGTGKIDIFAVETGPYLENQLSKKDEIRLCKMYSFGER